MDFLIAVMNSYVTGDFLVLASDGIWGDFEWKGYGVSTGEDGGSRGELDSIR